MRYSFRIPQGYACVRGSWALRCVHGSTMRRYCLIPFAVTCVLKMYPWVSSIRMNRGTCFDDVLDCAASSATVMYSGEDRHAARNRCINRGWRVYRFMADRRSSHRVFSYSRFGGYRVLDVVLGRRPVRGRDRRSFRCAIRQRASRCVHTWRQYCCASMTPWRW
jgi:hypothetical protein